MSKIEWQRTPVALRLGLLLTLASEVFHFGLWFAMDAEQVYRTAAWAAGSTAWMGGNVMCLFGVVALARRAPRATALVWAYATSVIMSLLWVVIEVWIMRAGGSPMSWFSGLQYLDGAVGLVLVVAWALVSRSALLTTVLAVTKLITDLPPLSEGLTKVLGLTSERTIMGSHAVLGAISTCAALAIAMRVPFARPLAPRVVRPGLFEAMAIAVAMAGVADVLLDTGALGSAMNVPLGLVLAASLAWFVVNALRARGADEPGAWPLACAGALWAAAAMGQLESLGGLSESRAEAPVMRSILVVGGLVFALTAMTRIARARGAEQALRVASAWALLVVIAGGVSIGASVGDTPLPGALRIVGLVAAFAAAAFGLRAAGHALGDGGDLPTATLRVS